MTTVVNGGPEDDVVDRAQHRLRHVTRTNARMASAFAGLTILGVGLLVAAGVQALALGLTATGMVLGGIYVVAWWRARRASSHVISGPYTPVHAVGWVRPGDGCNYGLYPRTAESAAGEPAWVLRLPVRRPMREADGWLCGSPKSSVLSGLALVGTDGDLLGYGRILKRAPGLRRWHRRAKPPGRLVQRPAETWYPPGSS